MSRRWAGESLQASYYAVEAFLAARAGFYLAYRLAMRVVQFASIDGGARTAAWQMTLVAFVALDIGSWMVLRSTDRFFFKTRLVIDSADIALWSLAPYTGDTPYALAVLVGFPLALEAGLRCGWVGLTVPAVTLASTVIVRSLFGRPAAPQFFTWLVVGVGCGLLLRRYIARLQEQAKDEWARRRSAEHRRAFLAGQNSVAMGASSAVDAIESVLPLLGRPDPGSVMWDVANSWKSALYESTVGHAAYLGHVLAEWAADHNRHPDLTSRVELHLREGIGTVLLTNDQEPALRHRLSGLALRGILAVDLEDPTTADRPPGGPLRLTVGPHLVEVPADPDRPPRPVDPGPAVFVLGSVLMLGDVVGFPLAFLPVAAPICLGFAGAWWAHLRLRRMGKAAWPAIMGAAVLIAVMYTSCATLALERPLNVAGLENYPVVPGLDLLAVLGAMYWAGLRPAMRWFAVGAAALLLVSTWLLHPIGHHPERVLLQAIGPLAVLVGALPLARELGSASDRYQRKLMDDDGDAEHIAFRRGQDTVIDLVHRARDEAYGRLGVVGATLAPPLAENVRHRLEEVDRRLARLEHRGGSSWSTTTS